MKPVIIASFLSALACAQEGIAVTATKIVEFAPEEATFNLLVLGDQDTTLEQVVNALKDTGITARDLVGISSQQQFGPGPVQTRPAYQFVYTTKFSAMKEMHDKINALRRTLVAESSKLEVQLFGTSISPAEATREKARQDALPELLEQAHRKAEFLSKSAGVSLGRIVGLVEPYFGGPPTGYVASVPYGSYGGPSVLRGSIGLTVRFAVQ